MGTVLLHKLTNKISGLTRLRLQIPIIFIVDYSDYFLNDTLRYSMQSASFPLIVEGVSGPGGNLVYK